MIFIGKKFTGMIYSPEQCVIAVYVYQNTETSLFCFTSSVDPIKTRNYYSITTKK